VTAITLPFPITFYGRSFTNANLIANGNMQFISGNFAAGNACLPVGGFNYAIFPFWTDLRTDLPGNGIFTSVTGTAPNRTFAIEWRATIVSSGSNANFEVLLYESQPRLDIIYGPLDDPGTAATVGIQRDTGSSYTNFECNAGGLSAGLQLTWQWSCNDGGGACLVSAFTGSPVAGANPLLVTFNNFSTGATNYVWDFGDGNTSTDTNTANLYTNAGTYTVTLSAIGPAGTNILAKTNYIVVTNAPPSITSPPQNALAAVGANTGFSVTASGTPPLGYQWRFGGSPLANATDTGLSLNGVICATAGLYDVVVSNVAGVRTSGVAVLTVVAPPGIAGQPGNQTVVAGQNASFSVAATNACGSGFGYQWWFGPSPLAGATNGSLVISNAQTANAGGYSVVVANFAGSITSSVALLTVVHPPIIVSQPASEMVVLNSNATFTVVAAGDAPLNYQWRFGGAPIPGATANIFHTNAQCADAGSYDVVVTNASGSATSAVAALTVVAPLGIASQPASETVVAGQAATFSVTATNACGGGFAYQWRFGGALITGATASIFTPTNAQCADAGAYDVIITNAASAATSTVAVLTVVAPPVLVTQPTNLTVAIGDTALFFVAATNDCGGVLTYQWQFGGTNLLGSTNATLIIANAQPFNAGPYDVIVTNFAGSITSQVAVLTVGVSAPVMILYPNQNGTNFVFYFATVLGKTYQVQYKDLIDATNWQTLQTTPGDGTTNTFTVPISAAAQRFFRLSVQ
jgi:PKD repeat protein